MNYNYLVEFVTLSGHRTSERVNACSVGDVLTYCENKYKNWHVVAIYNERGNNVYKSYQY